MTEGGSTLNVCMLAISEEKAEEEDADVFA